MEADWKPGANQCPQDEQLDEEHDEQPEPAAPALDEPAELAHEYLLLPTLEISLLAFFDLHFGQTVLGFSLKLNVTTSNCFLHLSH